MKNGLLFLWIIGVTAVCSCQKEPPKGSYAGHFEGSYTTETQVVYYTTDYVFEITKSTKSEIHLKEQASQMTSILQKKSNDSVVGRIGFGRIYDSSHSGGSVINTISVTGKYYKDGAKSCISGTFSTTLLILDSTSQKEKHYPSEGNFVLRSF